MSVAIYAYIHTYIHKNIYPQIKICAHTFKQTRNHKHMLYYSLLHVCQSRHQFLLQINICAHAHIQTHKHKHKHMLYYSLLPVCQSRHQLLLQINICALIARFHNMWPKSVTSQQHHVCVDLFDDLELCLPQTQMWAILQYIDVLTDDRESCCQQQHVCCQQQHVCCQHTCCCCTCCCWRVLVLAVCMY